MKINKAEEGEEKIREFVRNLVERKGVAETERETEEARARELLEDKVRDEILAALPDERVFELEDELDENEEISQEKLNSILFEEGIRPESVAGKVLKEFEQEYLGVENEEEEEE